MLTGVIFGLLLVSFICIALLAIALFSLSVEVKAITKSTHQIVMPSVMANGMFEGLSDESKEKMVRQPEEYDSIQ